MPYILALDQGTTSSRAIVFDQNANIVATGQREFQQIFPRPGWVEHDPNEIWATQIAVAAEALGRAHLRPLDIAALASPTSARRPSSGIARPALRSTTRSCGRTGARPTTAID